MELFVGIDQSINSSGVTIETYDNGQLINQHFYIITGKKLTKREQHAMDVYNNFDYFIYDKHDIKNAKDNHELELFKTYNIINISNSISNIIGNYITKYNCQKLYVCMEGISFGSVKTNSIIELAALNHIIRYDLMKMTKKIFPNVIFNLIVSPPAEIKKYASGDGTAKKEVMIGLFEASFPNLYLIPKIDDIADSYWMCKYAKNIYENTNG